MVIIGISETTSGIISDLLLQYHANDILLYNEDNGYISQTKPGVATANTRNGLFNHFEKISNHFIVLTINNHLREKLVYKYTQLGGRVHYFVSSTANYTPANSSVSRSNTVIMHNAMISASASIEEGCIVSPHAYVGHDAVIGRYVYLGERSGGSNTHIGAYSSIYAGSAVLPGAGLGQNCYVAGQSLVTKMFANDKTLKGIPAK
ncbi:MAG TPA: hypothetical protein PLW44_11170 [Chitinophagales bacterium]|nr:hypothetical protein [Chitinophagales bacterium]